MSPCKTEVCHIDDLPEEVTAIVMEYVGTGILGLLQFVSKSFHRVCLRLWKSMQGGKRLAIGPFCSTVGLLKWALVEGGYQRNSDADDDTLMRHAARLGQVDVMVFLRQQDPPSAWSSDVCCEASHGGHLSALRWLRSQNPPCPWDYRVVNVDLRHVDTLLWLKSLPKEELSDLSDGVFPPLVYISDAVQQSVWQFHETIKLDEDFEPMLELMRKCRNSAEAQDVISVCLQVLSNLVEEDSPLINQHIEFIGPFALEFMKSQDSLASMDAVHLLRAIIFRRPHFLVKRDMISMLIDGFADVFASEIWIHSPNGGGSAEYTTDEMKSHSLVLEEEILACLDLMALHVPPKSLLQVVLDKYHECTSQTNDKLQCKAGFVLLGTIAEGCADSLSLILPELIPQVGGFADDPSYCIRESVHYVLGQLARYCFPAVLDWHGTLASIIIQGLQDPMTSVQRLACLHADTMFEKLQPKIAAMYLADMVPIFHNLVKSPLFEIQEEAIRAFGLIAGSAEDYFLPFLEGSVANLTGIIDASDNSGEEHSLKLKGLLIEALSLIACGVSCEDFSPYFERAMRTVTAVIEFYFPLDSEILEYAYVFISNVSKTMEMRQEFHIYLPTLISKIQGSLEGSQHLAVHVAAIAALGSLAQHSYGLFTEYLDKTLDILDDVVGSSCPEIEESAFTNLQFFLISAGSAEGLSIPAAKPGEVLTIRGRVSRTLQRIMEWLWPVISSSIDTKAVTWALEALKSIVEYIGIVAMTLRDSSTFQTYGDLIKDMILEHFEGKSPCQKFLMSAHDEEGENEQHHKHVYSALCEVIEILAKMYGPSYLETFEIYIPHLLKFTEESRSFYDRSSAICAFANGIEGIGASALTHVDMILPAIKRGCEDEIAVSRQNACYCVSVVVDLLSDDKLEFYLPSFIDWITPIAIRNADDCQSTNDPDVDNAVAALCRIIKRIPESDEVSKYLPIVLDALPLTCDFDEVPTIYNMLVTLLTVDNANSATLLSLEEILRVFADVLTEDSPYPPNMDVTNTVTNCLRELSATDYSGSLDIRGSLQKLSLSGDEEIVEIIEQHLD